MLPVARLRSARATVERYLDVLYNERRLDLIPELIADPTWRHKAGEVKSLAYTRRSSGARHARPLSGAALRHRGAP